MPNINKIRLSGTTYTVQDLNATKTVELTQAEYDDLAPKDPNTFYIITDATAGNLSNYYTKSETDGLLDTKLDVTAYTPTDLTNYYTKTEVDEAIKDLDVTGQLKNHYTKAEVDAKDAAINATIEALSSDTKNKIDAEVQARESSYTTLQGHIHNVNSVLTAHTADTTIHVTQADKDKWNTPTDLSNYYTKSEVDEGIKDLDVNGKIKNH